MERERCNQDAIEEERAGLMKLKEVRPKLFAGCLILSVFVLHMQEKNNEILGYNNEVNKFHKVC